MVCIGSEDGLSASIMAVGRRLREEVILVQINSMQLQCLWWL
jgi:hypothetical protein